MKLPWITAPLKRFLRTAQVHDTPVICFLHFDNKMSPDDPRIEQIGFAKLLGEDLELYAKKYDIIIGRKSKSSVVDVVLGTSISFFHE